MRESGTAAGTGHDAPAAPRRPRRRVRVAHQGMAGSVSEAAARVWASLEGFGKPELVPAMTAKSVLVSLRCGEADYGVLAVSNNVSGLNGDTAEALSVARYETIASVTIPVHLSLFVRPGDEGRVITAVYSHPASIFQCERSISKHLPAAEPLAAPASSLAARRLATGELPEDSAVICSPAAGRMNGLSMLVERMNDSASNETSFVVLSVPRDARRTKRRKIA